MAIKAIVNDGKAKVEKPFPKLMISDIGGIYLMTNSNFAVNINGRGCQFGQSPSPDVYSELKDFDGSVTLTNE